VTVGELSTKPPAALKTWYSKGMKNTHLQHPEDSILNGDLSVLDWFTAHSHLSVKIDGAPAIVWGTNPANGMFFVGTKSVFNKVKIKINHSHDEIDANHSGEVAKILHACFDCLPHTNTVYQGDFIGFGGSAEYKPNTITYLFPEVIEQKIIIAPHTCYYAESDLRDAVAMPDRSIWCDTPKVKFVQPTASIFAGAEYFADLKEVCKFAKVMALGVEFATPKVAAQIKQQLNACIREGREVNPDDFENPNLISFWKLVKSIKEDAVYLCRNDGPQAYINGNRIDAEGYVMSNEFGMFKLVNREVFSYANFNHGKFQCAG
jgi:hypothetical protein